MFRLFWLLCLSSICWADLPIDCRFSDVVGTWTITETDREFDSSIHCITMGEVVYHKTFTLDYPNIVTDELGFKGTWTLIYNQGFEVNINERSYWANFEHDLVTFTYNCNKLDMGWARDDTVRHWSCYTGEKDGVKAESTTRKFVKREESPALDEKFVNDEDFIRRINAAQSSWTAKAYPENEKYTYRDMLQRAGGSYHPLPPTAPVTAEQKARAAVLPTNFDWRDIEGVNYISPVRDQGQCGSCYSFASTALLEARVRIETRNARQDIFSPQDILSCSMLNEGCGGGFAYLTAGRYAMDEGFVEESCNTYYGGVEVMCKTDMSCPRTYVSDYSFIGGYYGGGNEESMMEAILASGPIAVDYMVESDFYSYDGGIYHHVADVKTDYDPFFQVNHVVLVVGYGVQPITGEKFWIVKNSWGPEFGEQGYFRIRKGTNECGIESAAFDTTVIS